MLYSFDFIMLKTLIILYALSFWVTAGRPKRGRSFPHWLESMIYTVFFLCFTNAVMLQDMVI
jgi:hypothetical protein